MWRAYAGIAEDAWVDAIEMAGAQVAAVDYAPAGWPADTYTIVRRVRVDAETISADPRSRRRRTIDPDQLALALEGTATHAYAVSFIVTNVPANDRPGDTAGNAESILEVEAWFRRRTDIEDRIREAKLGAALRKLPSGSAAVNTVWMWAALLAGNLSVLLQTLTGIDEHGRAPLRGGEVRRVRGEHHGDTESAEPVDVAVEVPGVGREVLAGPELKRVDEDAHDDHVTSGARFVNEGEVSFVKRSHGRDQPDRRIVGKRGELRPELFLRSDDFHWSPTCDRRTNPSASKSALMTPATSASMRPDLAAAWRIARATDE
jgi:hypothetical protein